jgi:RNA-dependent RNA polymerase
VFTPDCGKMSPQIARDIAKELGMDYTPSVIKFNLGGARGILMLSNYLTKRKIQLRSSQIRFDSMNTWLDVIKVSKPNRVHLNRRTVTLLSSLGVEPYVFQELFKENLAYWEECKHGKQITWLGDFQKILDCKFLERSDPFISNIVSSYHNYLLKGLKEDCRLHIHNGVKVFAVADETDTLNAGEIFLQLTAPSGLAAHRKVIEGPCVIYRDSSCFPADVRVLNAVNYSQLRHYTNVLIFSVIDIQDLPSLCSNDDPAEDNFTVIWDLRLLPTKITLIPRSYTTIVSPNNLKKITFREVSKFFTTYISRDTIQLLNSAYVAFSDRHTEGIFNGDCFYLSQQFCRALGKKKKKNMFI